MIRLLVRHHPLLRPMLVKWLLMGVAFATMWLGVLVYRLARNDAPAAPWALLASIWIVPAIYLAFGGQTHRARIFPLTLPLEARRLWTAHLLAAALTSGGMLLISIGVLHLAVRGMAAAPSRRLDLIVSAAAQMPAVWLHGAAWWLLLLALVTAERPELAELRRDRRWLARTAAATAACLAGLLWLSPLGGPLVAAAAGLLAVVLLARTAGRVPPALALAGRELTTAPAAASAAAATDPPPAWKRRPLWLTVVTATSKHPVMYVVGLPFTLLMGLLLSGGMNVITDGVNTGTLFVGIVAYGIFAMVGAPLNRLSIFDHLPISRGRLLACVLLPTVLLVLTGFAIGGITGDTGGGESPLGFGSDPERGYGVRLSEAYRPVIWGVPPATSIIDGESVEIPVDWSPLGWLGPTIYRPHHTPPGSSLETCAEQLALASARVFDRPIPAADFRDRYLRVDETGLVVLRAGGMDLVADYPDRELRRFPGVAPLNLLLAGVLFGAAYAAYLTRFRPGIGDGGRKASFVITLVVLMAVYMLPFVLGMTGFGDPDVVVVLAHALSAWLLGALPGGLASLWLLVVLLLGAGGLLILHGFRRAEWPPVREDESVIDVLG